MRMAILGTIKAINQVSSHTESLSENNMVKVDIVPPWPSKTPNMCTSGAMLYSAMWASSMSVLQPV